MGEDGVWRNMDVLDHRDPHFSTIPAPCLKGGESRRWFSREASREILALGTKGHVSNRPGFFSPSPSVILEVEMHNRGWFFAFLEDPTDLRGRRRKERDRERLSWLLSCIKGVASPPRDR